jgi:hypothetical protein
MLGLRRYLAVWRCLYLGVPVWRPKSDPKCHGQQACLAGLFICHLWYLFHLVWCQRPNAGHEDLAYSACGHCRPPGHATPGTRALCAELGLVFASVDCDAPIWLECGRNHRDRLRLGGYLGCAQPVSSPSPVLARCASRHTTDQQLALSNLHKNQSGARGFVPMSKSTE